MILATLVSPGCVRSRDIVLHVSDIDSGEPIESARVTVTRSGVGTFAKFGAGSVAHFQEGLQTNTATGAEWERMVLEASVFLRLGTALLSLASA